MSLEQARRIKPRALKRKKIQASLSGVKQRSCKQQMPAQAQRPTPTTQRAAADGLGELGVLTQPGSTWQREPKSPLRPPCPSASCREAEQGTQPHWCPAGQSQLHAVLPALGWKCKSSAANHLLLLWAGSRAQQVQQSVQGFFVSAGTEAAVKLTEPFPHRGASVMLSHHGINKEGEKKLEFVMSHSLKGVSGM